MALTRINPNLIKTTGAEDGSALIFQSNGIAWGAPSGGGGAEIRTPIITSPTDNATGVTPTPIIEGSVYAPLYSADIRDYRQLQIDIVSGDFSDPVIDQQANTDNITVSTSLNLNTEFKARIRDVSTTGAESDWSGVVSFTTANITVNQPTLTVEGSPDAVPESPTLTTSAFATTPTGEDTHLSTDWQVLEGVTVVFESLNDTVNLLSIIVPVGNLDPNTTYTFRARHIGTLLGAGEFAEVTATTVEQFDITPLLAVAHSNTPFITIYNQEIDTFTKLANPATLPTNTGNDVAFSSDDTYMAVAHNNSPFITIYKRSGDTFTKLADPTSLPASTSLGVAFSSDDTYMAVAHGTTPFVTIYKRDGDTFTKLANPGTLPTGAGQDVAFSSDDTYMAVGHTTTPFITIYKRDGDTFTKLANPALLPAGNGNDVAFSSDDTYMAVAHTTTPFITIYKRSGDTFTKLANPGTLPAGTGIGVAFSSDDLYMAVAHDTTPFIAIYKRSGDTFTKLANPAALPSNAGNDVAFSSDDTYMAVAHFDTPFITIYKRSGDTFTKLANPAALPASVGRGVAFSNTGFPQ